MLVWIASTILLYALISAWALYTIAAETKEYWDLRHILYALFWPLTLALALWQQWRHAGRQARKAKEKIEKK
jgi:hypothetical protein